MLRKLFMVVLLAEFLCGCSVTIKNPDGSINYLGSFEASSEYDAGVLKADAPSSISLICDAVPLETVAATVWLSGKNTSKPKIAAAVLAQGKLVAISGPICAAAADGTLSTTSGDVAALSAAFAAFNTAVAAAKASEPATVISAPTATQ